MPVNVDPYQAEQKKPGSPCQDGGRCIVAQL